MNGPVDVGVELGGTKIVVASSESGADLLDRVRIPTTSPHETTSAIRTAIERVATGRDIAAIGIGSFGPLDLRPRSPSFGTIISTPKPDWSGVDLVEQLTDGRSVPVGVDTDVGVAVRGERAWGAARDMDAGSALVYMTVGTGVGAALMVAGDVVRGANHSEMGHMMIPRHPDDDFGGRCPFHGATCLEGMASGPAIADRWGSAAEELVGGQLSSAVELEAWYLGRAIVSICAVAPVELVILGGGVSNMRGLREAVKSQSAEAAGLYPPVPFGEGGPTVVAPGLGEDAGVIGAIEIGRAARRGSAATRG